MGCQVQVSTEQPYFRTEKVKGVSLLHVFRAIVFFTMSLIVEDVFMVLLWIAIAEIVVAGWFWNMKMESWGVSAGVCLFHFLFPATLGVSLIATGLILTASLAQIIILGLIRTEGGFSFNHIAQLDQAEMREATSLEKTMFQLSVLAQVLKTLSMIVGGLMFVVVLGFAEVLPWLVFIPAAPIVVILLMLDIFATVGLFAGKDWGFHLTLIMVPISFVETMLTLNPLIFLLSIWVLTILIPCLAKDGFYSKLLQNVRTEFSTVPKK